MKNLLVGLMANKRRLSGKINLLRLNNCSINHRSPSNYVFVKDTLSTYFLKNNADREL